MAPSSGASSGGGLAHDVGEVQRGRDRGHKSDFSQARRFVLLSGRGEDGQHENRRAGASHGARGGREDPSHFGHFGARVRRGHGLWNCVGSGAAEAEAAPQEDRKQRQLRERISRGRRHGGRTSKSLARYWFRRRKDKGRENRGVPGLGPQEVQKVCTHREEEPPPQLFLSRQEGSADSFGSGRQVRRPLTWPACSPAGREYEARKKSSSEVQPIRQQQLRRQQVVQELERQQQGLYERRKRSCSRCSQLQESWEEKIPATLAPCTALCEVNRGGPWSSGQAFQNHRSEQEDTLREATEPEEVSLPLLHHSGVPAEGRAAQSSTANGAGLAGYAPGCNRWKLGSGVVTHASRRSLPPTDLRRGPSFVAACDKLPPIDERPRQEHRESSKKGGRKRPRRGAGRQRPKFEEPWKRSEGQQGEREGQGQQRCLRPSETYEQDFPASRVVQCLDRSFGSFGRFWKMVKSFGYSQRSGPRTSSCEQRGIPLFPSLLVMPESNGKSRSARLRARRRDRDESWKHVEILWAYFTFLDGGSPFKRSDQERLLRKAARAPWTSLHSSYAGSLHAEIQKFVRLRSNDTPLSRGIHKISELIKVVRNSSYSSSQSLEQLTRIAKDVMPERMSLPASAGIVDPELFLKGQQLEMFQQMPTAVPHGVEPPNPTKGCFRVPPDKLQEVNFRLLESGVAVLIPEELGLRDSRGELITGGLFAVDHKPTSDRIILDRRPFNELERRLVWAKLPHGSLLTQLIVPPGFSIRGSGDDLSNYFYLLKHQEAWLPRNAIGKTFDGRGYEKFGGIPGKKYLLSFRVIAMGDLNAVDIAQQVHLEILRDCCCMNVGECLEFRSPLPASHTLEGLYIDDHIITQILPSKKNRKNIARFRDEELLARSREQYQKKGIPISSGKAFEKCDNYTAWGTEVDSRSGRVGAPQRKLKHLSELIASVCSLPLVCLPLVSKKLLQGIVGLLVHPFTHRRNLMCVLQDTFVWIEKLRDGESRGLPNSVKEELTCCGLLLPVCHSNVRWGVSKRLGASDASLSHGGRCASLVTSPIAQTLYRCSEHKGEHVRLDWASGALQPETRMQRAPDELEQLIGDLPWNQTETCSFAHKQHINILETKMIYRELRDVVMQSRKPLRCVLVVDSRAAAGAWAKGRSSLRNLNRVLRQALGWSIAGQKTIHVLWVRSEANPADYPSRGKRIPEPPLEPTGISEIAFGEDLPKFRLRRSNRDIWHAVKQDALCTDSPGVAAGATSVHVEPGKLADQVDGLRKNFPSGPNVTAHPATKHWSFREILSGAGHLTQTFRDRRFFAVKAPFEIMHKGKVNPNCDILDDTVFEKLCKDACEPNQLWHFGFPCGSFSLLQNMNKGTRTAALPLGDGSVKRERIGNEIMHRTLHLCHLLHKHGSKFTLENPRTSFAWKTPKMLELISKCDCTIVHFDQCQYGLKIPDQHGVLGLAKKSTTMVGTMPDLHKLYRVCDHTHLHVPVVGGVKHNGKWQKRSTLAGTYPGSLCVAYCKLFEKAFTD